jgi:hypothetical protein
VKVQGGGCFGRNSALDVGLDKGTKAYCQGIFMVFQNFLLAPGVCKIPLQGRRSMRSRAHVLLPDRLAWLSLRIAAASATLAELMEGGIAFALPFRSRGLARLAGGRCLAPWLLGRRQT